MADQKEFGLAGIIGWHRKGTRYGIGQDEADGLFFVDGGNDDRDPGLGHDGPGATVECTPCGAGPRSPLDLIGPGTLVGLGVLTKMVESAPPA